MKQTSTAKDILSNEESLEDFLDYLHIQNIKALNEETSGLDEVKAMLNI